MLSHDFVLIVQHGGSLDKLLRRIFVFHCAISWLRLAEQVSLRLPVQLEQWCHLHVEEVCSQFRGGPLDQREYSSGWWQQ